MWDREWERRRVPANLVRRLGRDSGAVSVRVCGGEVEAPGLKPRDRVAGVGRLRKNRDGYAGALLAQGNASLLKNIRIDQKSIAGRGSSAAICL